MNGFTHSYAVKLDVFWQSYFLGSKVFAFGIAVDVGFVLDFEPVVFWNSGSNLELTLLRLV